ncbi:hypothetical protein F2Q69_00037816 [Brassica cretica]|uniref:CCHC-type domain-containing protein n=1 Tax=Brassica cretica TaxID=69181 RepID=A0A8S9SNW9_BRACR|nr:hypothetical protein F2Q69_00037816 [Brassica cretica]
MKYYPKEAMDREKCGFEHVSQGEIYIREYEVVFNQLRRFAGVGISEKDLIRKFLSGMRVEIRNRCRVVTYHRLGDLVEKAAEQEAGLAEVKKLAKAVHVKSGKAPESQRRAGDPSELPRCPRCHRSHSGQCMRCLTCGKMGHTAKYCWVKPLDTPPVRQIAAPAAPAVAQVCFGCGQPGHIVRDCMRRGNAALPPPPKRLAIAPRVFAVGDPQGAKPITVEIRNRCRIVTYHRLGDLVEKAAEQEAGLAEEKKLAKAVHVKSGKAPETQRRAGDPSGLPRCPRCHRSHSGQCMRCLTCGKMGQTAKYCWVKPLDTPPVRQIAAPAAPAVAQVCFGCGQPGHIVRDCPRRANAALPPPPKRLAIAPRVFAGRERHTFLILIGGEAFGRTIDRSRNREIIDRLFKSGEDRRLPLSPSREFRERRRERERVVMRRNRVLPYTALLQSFFATAVRLVTTTDHPLALSS